MGLLLDLNLILAQVSGPSGFSGGLLSNPWFYAGFSAVSMAVGSAVALWLDPRRGWQAILLAVGGGSLVISLAFELFDPAFHNIGRWGASGFFVAGVGTFGGLDILIDGR
ncbi:ZIP family metal transporter [Halorussus ruber]|uniref:hypothetical protein n=1 Tax=Halorussus ruber TaxID=1126238 RepID=UPI0010928DA4|nr:hypothetical protein [Halorussus ruber]